MTMRWVQVTQQGLQREFYRASHNTTLRHSVPKLPLSLTTPPPRPDLSLHSRFDRRRHSSFCKLFALTYKTPKPRANYIDSPNGSAKLTKNSSTLSARKMGAL
jgi:hypothetical protein